MIIKTHSLRAFSLVELLISLIVISCITAAFTPLITKKFSSGVFGGGGSVSDITADCEKFGPNCNLCTSNFCLSCTGLTCNSDEYKDNKSCSCKKCVDKFGADCTKCNEDKCLICPDGQYLNRDDNCVSCTTKFNDCATCNEDQCLSCKDGGMLTNPTSTTPCSSFNCSSPDFMQIGNLCITKKNMGDSTTLTIPSGVNVKQVGQSCSPSSTNFCCWQGNTAGTSCDSENSGGYSGCNRTVCDNYASEYICNNFHAGAYNWRLATKSEMSIWGNYSIGLGTHGLQLCDHYSGYLSPECGMSFNLCPGSADNNCSLRDVWSGELVSSNVANYYYLGGDQWRPSSVDRKYAYSIRCVATMPQSCADRLGTGCLACDGATCLSCGTGYVLKNGKCEAFDCSGDDFIQVGNLCVTKKNLGDSSALSIPTGVNVVNAGISCSPSSTNFCCWRGNTADSCDAENGGYSGCNRTVCDHYAADYSCKNFNYAGYTWRLPTLTEMENWNLSSVKIKNDGLQLCNGYSGYLSAQCFPANVGTGASTIKVSPNAVWSSNLNGTNQANYFYLTRGLWEYTSPIDRATAFSIRCVTPMSQSCESKYGAGCLSCNNTQCLSCDSNNGYLLRNGKCKSTFCKGSDFMLIGNLCVTRKNMGDSTTLKIPSGVNVINAGSTCNSSSSNMCCWKGSTSGSCDNENGGGYSGCNRTVCDWYSADYICKNFNYNGKTWRLPTANEMNYWNIYSIEIGTNGLQLCDQNSGNSSAQCYYNKNCFGSYGNNCYPSIVWTKDPSGSKMFVYCLSSKNWRKLSYYSNDPFSVRCVTEL